MFKHLLIDGADRMAAFAKWRAQRWLDCSRRWSAFAESLETGEAISSIRKGEERDV